MASTRNINTPGNYCLQQKKDTHSMEYELYKNSQLGRAYSPAIPCIGYMPSHMPRDTLSSNPIEIESALFGINSTNLVTPQPPTVPKLKTIPMKEFFQRVPMIMPLPMVIENNQRPLPIP